MSADVSRRPRLTGTILGAAALITVLTVLARVAGFGRIWVFSRTVGYNDLADVYQTINTVPNILYEIVAGGVLASLVVPLLSRSAAVGDRERVNQTSSALLTWTVLVLTPIAVAVALAAGPIAQLLLGADADSEAVDVGASMLRVFAPQIVLYGIGVVLTGILQAHKRFGGPAVAPLLSSLVVIGAYVGYAVVAPVNGSLQRLTPEEELVLSVGTTLGVVALSLSLTVPLARLGVRLRPRLGFPVGVARTVRSLAYAGAAALTAQQVSILVALMLGNRASEATVAVYNVAQTVYFLPWAILAVPIATSVFPRLAERWAAGEPDAYREQLSAATRLTLVACLAASGAMVAAAEPIARVMAQGAPGVDSVSTLETGVIGFSFGLTGYGLFALLSRALYAAGRMSATAVACVAGWLTVVVADLVLSGVLDPADRVLALSLGNSIGMVVLGVALVLVTRGTVGPAAVAAALPVAAGSVLAATAGGAAGWWVGGVLDTGGVAVALGQGLLAAAVATGVFALVVGVTCRAPIISSLHTLRRAEPTLEDHL